MLTRQNSIYISAIVDSNIVEVENTHIKRCDEPEPSKPMTHATMQAIMSGCYEGLGLGIGSLMGGLAIDKIGIFHTWRYAAFFALGTMLCNVVIEIIKDIKRTKSS
jgi:hypothetical protein